MATIKYKDPATNQWVEIPTGLVGTVTGIKTGSVTTSPINGIVTIPNGKDQYGVVKISLGADNYLYINTDGN